MTPINKIHKLPILSILVVGLCLVRCMGPVCAQDEGSPFFQTTTRTGTDVTAPGDSIARGPLNATSQGDSNPAVRERLPQTRNEKTPSGTGGQGRFFVALLKIFFSLALVIALFLAFAWLLKKLNPALASGLPRDVLSVLGQTTLTSRHRLFLVRFGSKLVLITVSGDQAEAVAELTDAREVSAILSRLGTDEKDRVPAGGRGDGLLSQLLTGKEPRA